MSAHLVLMPELRFAELGALLGRAGWQTVSQASDPLVPGEPEHASFERTGARVVYTYNPVCALRVLDTTAAGAAALDAALPLADAGAVRGWLASADERTVLRGILAAARLGEAALAPQVDACRRHPRRAIARAAERALQVLQPDTATDGARGGALLAIEVMKEQLAPLLQALAHERDGRIAASLAPQPGDFALAFTAQAAHAASRAYAAAPAARVAPIEGASELQITLAPAGMLADDNALSRQFPSGYGSIAHLLAPQRIWARWKYLRPGVAYDGLVWLDKRWVWFPKPYRVLSA